MAAGEEDEAEKEFEPSERKLTQAREKGDIVRTEDLQAAVALAGLVLSLLLLGPWVVASAGQAGMAFLDQPDRISQLMSEGAGAQIFGLAFGMAGPTMLLLAVPAMAVLAFLIASRSLIFAPTKLEFKVSRISIISNAKQKFGLTGMVEFAKKFAKMAAVSALLTLYLHAALGDILLSAHMEPGPFTVLLADRTMGFLYLFLVLGLVFGLADYVWQRFDFTRRNRMSRKELMDEMKESEGDPHMKADRRRRAQEIAMNRMLVDVPKADVVIVNPTHYAVALVWDRGKGNVPRCVAKGTDEIAARIRERAQEAGVPIHSNPPAARALFATVGIGHEIQPEHFAAVAAAIRFADAMRKKARRR